MRADRPDDLVSVTVIPSYSRVFHKEMEVTRTGVVYAYVKDSTGATVGYESFIGMLNTAGSLRRRLRKAHEWADKYIDVLNAEL